MKYLKLLIEIYDCIVRKFSKMFCIQEVIYNIMQFLQCQQKYFNFRSAILVISQTRFSVIFHGEKSRIF